ncbi:RNA methyltransferase [Candidatus Poribacteria bacterium]|nr:RNA methyltransferase [Candidatus Poribacteria bacterium]
MIYSIFVIGGLENIARQELNSRFGETKDFKIILRKPRRIVFQFTGNPKDLLSIRSAEHLFLVIRHIPKITRSRSSLASIRHSLNRFNFEEVMTICRQVGLRIKKRVQFRVITRMAGFRNFQKRDLHQVVERVLIERGWKLSDSNSGLDVWNEVYGDDAYISIRLSTSDFAQRSRKQISLSDSIKPTLAYSMVRLSRPQPNDIFLDPMCGAGTILLERANSGRYRYLIGGDLSKSAIDATLNNFGRQHQPCQFFYWNVQSLPLQPNSIDKIVCNFPTDIQQQELIKNCLDKFNYLIKPSGNIVLHTTHGVQLKKMINQQNTMKLRQQVNVGDRESQGQIFVIHTKLHK